MRWSTYLSPSDNQEHVGLWHDGAFHGLAAPRHLIDLLSGQGESLADAAERARRDPLEVLDGAEVHLCAPIPVPPSIRDFMAFEEHLISASKGLGRTIDPVWYQQPIFYFTNPAAVIGPHDPVPIAPGSQDFDYELEIAAVIGRRGSDLDPAEAEEHIAGYMILCDWSARDLQRVEMKGNLGPAKGKDTATSLGPFMVTPDELAPFRLGNAYNLDMTASVNGAEWTRGNMSTIYWTFAQLVAYASRGTELRTGDIIGSGTVGTGCILELSSVHGHDTYPWLKAGDELCLEVEGMGAITTTVLPGKPVTPLRSG